MLPCFFSVLTPPFYVEEYSNIFGRRRVAVSFGIPGYLYISFTYPYA